MDRRKAGSPRGARGMRLLRQLIKFNKATAGRDKLYRVVQYACRFILAYLGDRKDLYVLISRLSKLKTALTFDRKLMRMFRSVDYSVSALDAAWKEEDATLRLLTVLDFANRAGRMLFDHFEWANHIGVLRIRNAQQVSRVASTFWLLGLVTSLLRSKHLFTKLWEAEAAARTSGASDEREQAAVIAQRKQQLLLDMARDCFDLPMPLVGSGAATIAPSLVGLSGTISSLIGFYQVWVGVVGGRGGEF